jgi:hypothetical protein
MTENRMRAAWLVLAALLGVAAVLWVQPYTVFSPYGSYSDPARQFLRAALLHDSLALQRQAGSPGPVKWALDAARANPQDLAIWAQALRPLNGRRTGDTTVVVFQTSTRTCYLRPLVVSFAASLGRPRILKMSSSCLAGH